MKDLAFLICFDKKDTLSCINTYNGEFIKAYSDTIEKFAKRNDIRVLDQRIYENSFYKYDVTADPAGFCCLNVYHGELVDDRTKWEKVYTVTADISHTGIKEEGDCDLAFWHEYFATCLGSEKAYCEYAVKRYTPIDCMKEIRKVFIMELQENAFLFFERYKNLKKYKVRHFDTSIFNIPSCKIPKTVGKIYDGKEINYVVEHEVELEGEVFFDLNILSGPVENGMITPNKTSRIFLTSGYWYSPDGGELGILTEKNTYGVVYSQKMQKAHPELMLDKYNGTYKYQYIVSSTFIPCFELLAKAGFSFIADLMLGTYYNAFDSYEKGSYRENGTISYNLYGKNDKEIFGFKMSKFKHFDNDCFTKRWNGNMDFFDYVNTIKRIMEKDSGVIERYNHIYPDLFDYLSSGIDISKKTMDYLFENGFDNWRLYNDYRRMGQTAGLLSGGLYPKNIKHEHDVMVQYINEMSAIRKNRAFEERVKADDYQELLYDGEENDPYCILAPRKAEDLANEGLKLHHCVRSYVELVSRGSTKIYFLREKERKASSLVTLEVKDGIIIQARGKYNRIPYEEEIFFIYKWAKERRLTPNFSTSRYIF